MAAIPIKPAGRWREYDSFEAAVAGAENDPRQARARSDSKTVQELQILGGLWRNDHAVIRFSNSTALRVVVASTDVEWSIQATEAASGPVQSTPAMELDWGSAVGVVSFDPNAILDAVTGARVLKLFVSEAGLHLYSRGNPTLTFHPVTRVDTGSPFLFMFLEDD